MDRKRIRFYVALAVFAAWIAALGYLAARTSERPQPQMTTGGDLLKATTSGPTRPKISIDNPVE